MSKVKQLLAKAEREKDEAQQIVLLKQVQNEIDRVIKDIAKKL